MNKSIEKIIETTENKKVREVAAKMMSAGNRKMKVQFVKKDGTIRDMICSFRDTWNGMNGFDTTKSGLDMVLTKISKGMATVTEWLGDGQFRPRTINLNTVTSLSFV